MRPKKKPVRRRVEDDSGGEITSEVLGRFQLRNSQFLDYMRANEIDADIKDDKEESGNEVDVSADDNEQRNGPRRHALSDDSESNDSDPEVIREIPPTLAAIERQIAAQERQRRKQNKQKKPVKKRKRPVKQVSFAKEAKSDIFPLPELIIENAKHRRKVECYATATFLSTKSFCFANGWRR